MRTATPSRRRLGFTLVELLIVISIILIIAAMVGPNLIRSRSVANETAAIGAIRTLHIAQTQYYAQFSRYATTLAELGPPASGSSGRQAADLIPGSLASGLKGGYRYSLEGTPSGYRIHAEPEVFGTSGNRTFYSDQSQTLRENEGPDPATPQSKPLH